MERYQRGKGKQSLLGNHQKCWIWGRNAVRETLQAGRWRMHELWLADGMPEAEADEARILGAALGAIVSVVPASKIENTCRSSEHQGYAARMTEFPYRDAVEVLATLPENPVCAVLDGIQDPYNFGSILRSAEVLGVDAVFIGTAGQVGVTSMVVRSSAGAVNNLPLVRVENLVALLKELKARGMRVAGASEKATATLAAFDFARPSVVVIGNEGHGPQPDIIAACDTLVRIPQNGRIGSLNASVAAAICFYEARQQRSGKLKP
ncbi:MAG: 23S rRNA (guanosine(2251)-2'-O)-methyltransferase RlmB [bacterium]